jgi:hypothetical protein
MIVVYVTNVHELIFHLYRLVFAEGIQWAMQSSSGEMYVRQKEWRMLQQQQREEGV